MYILIFPVRMLLFIGVYTNIAQSTVGADPRLFCYKLVKYKKRHRLRQHDERAAGWRESDYVLGRHGRRGWSQG